MECVILFDFGGKRSNRIEYEIYEYMSESEKIMKSVGKESARKELELSRKNNTLIATLFVFSNDEC